MALTQELSPRPNLTPLELLNLCRDQSMREVCDLVDRWANCRSVLILGENGTGKELVANALKQCGDRSEGPFVVLDCTHFGGDTLKSELFGHEKGSFTGASSDRIGLFESADKGTAFLDEVGEIPLAEQPKLLRVLQGGTFNRLGSSDQRKSDFRLIAATNKNLAEMVSKGKFRQDLYYRLETFKITVPPLRERLEDVVRLANHFVDVFAPGKRLHADTEKALRNYQWPGNVRQLKSAVERAAVFAGERDAISVEDLGIDFNGSNPSPHTIESAEVAFAKSLQRLVEVITSTASHSALGHEGLLDHVEKLAIEAVLGLNHGNVTQTGLQLGINDQSLRNKLVRYGLRRYLVDELTKPNHGEN